MLPLGASLSLSPFPGHSLGFWPISPLPPFFRMTTHLHSAPLCDKPQFN